MAGLTARAGWPLLSAGLLVAVAAWLAAVPAEGSPGITTRVSVTSAGEEVASGAGDPSISADGRYIAFVGRASEFGLSDGGQCFSQGGIPYECGSVIVRDLATGAIEMASVNSGGQSGNGNSRSPSLSSDGRFVAFISTADNLVPGDTNNVCDYNANGDLDNCADVFVHDRQTGATQRVSVASDGSESACPQADVSQSLPLPCVLQVAISGNGRLVAFSSSAMNLVANDTNGQIDVFAHDREARTTIAASVNSAGEIGDSGSEDPAISDDGQFVAFASIASNLSPADTNQCGDPESPRACWDVFVHDFETAQTRMVSVNSQDVQPETDSQRVSMSGNGRYVAFQTYFPGDQTVDVFVRDLATGITEATISGSDSDLDYSGRFVAVESGASELVPGDTNEALDIFVYDRTTGSTERVSVSSDGRQAAFDPVCPDILRSIAPTISGDGQRVAFQSNALNLAPLDLNGAYDVFLHDRSQATLPPTVTPAPDRTPTCLAPPGPAPPGPTQPPSSDGACNGCGGGGAEETPVVLPSTGGAAGESGLRGGLAILLALSSAALVLATMRLVRRRRS